VTKLTFPTIAEQVLSEFRGSTVTQSINKIALKRGASRDDQYGEIVWVFDDDTTLHIVGRGKNHRVWAELP
jgi:hypothetical protein